MALPTPDPAADDPREGPAADFAALVERLTAAVQRHQS